MTPTIIFALTATVVAIMVFTVLVSDVYQIGKIDGYEKRNDRHDRILSRMFK